MRRLVVKMLVAVLAIVTISTVTLDRASAQEEVFWAHPSTTDDYGGTTFSTTTTISRDQLIDINNYFNTRDTNKSVQYGIATTLISTPLSYHVSIPAGLAVSLLTGYSESQGDIVNDHLINHVKSNYTVTIDYRYKQVGSSDGYYYIDSISIY
ncbi:hypothetical protein [Alteribacillus bidgolensis]|uniref:Uncharacterized protein n=1 Tax=Alteribacillus bidgolensis TaxID=930129 RepID=A0A1G8MY91_9BACI|nr:hypothetical protein [Alteribacillus bidgolensis]SDI72777.1 hypothetical protein SAMN05216352_11123 [Alteribacillus bidgolensis]